MIEPTRGTAAEAFDAGRVFLMPRVGDWLPFDPAGGMYRGYKHWEHTKQKSRRTSDEFDHAFLADWSNCTLKDVQFIYERDPSNAVVWCSLNPGQPYVLILPTPCCEGPP